VAEHPIYRASGRDLYIDLPLTPWEAVLGTSVRLPTPAGAVTLKVPPGTRAGQELRLTGRGMKRGSGVAGHLHAVVRIDVPTVVDDKQKALYRAACRDLELQPAGPTRAGGCAMSAQGRPKREYRSAIARRLVQ
jgi:curved DNA-binding protein